MILLKIYESSHKLVNAGCPEWWRVHFDCPAIGFPLQYFPGVHGQVRPDHVRRLLGLWPHPARVEAEDPGGQGEGIKSKGTGECFTDFGANLESPRSAAWSRRWRASSRWTSWQSAGIGGTGVSQSETLNSKLFRMHRYIWGTYGCRSYFSLGLLASRGTSRSDETS